MADVLEIVRLEALATKFDTPGLLIRIVEVFTATFDPTEIKLEILSLMTVMLVELTMVLIVELPTLKVEVVLAKDAFPTEEKSPNASI